jgi:hypothetical protein
MMDKFDKETILLHWFDIEEKLTIRPEFLLWISQCLSLKIYDIELVPFEFEKRGFEVHVPDNKISYFLDKTCCEIVKYFIYLVLEIFHVNLIISLKIYQ